VFFFGLICAMGGAGGSVLGISRIRSYSGSFAGLGGAGGGVGGYATSVSFTGRVHVGFGVVHEIRQRGRRRQGSSLSLSTWVMWPSVFESVGVGDAMSLTTWVIL